MFTWRLWELNCVLINLSIFGRLWLGLTLHVLYNTNYDCFDHDNLCIKVLFLPSFTLVLIFIKQRHKPEIHKRHVPTLRTLFG